MTDDDDTVNMDDGWYVYVTGTNSTLLMGPVL